MTASSIMNLMILDLSPHLDAEYIANYFWKNNIAKVSAITIIPYEAEDPVLNDIHCDTGTAYIKIDSFCDTEAAKDFIYHMTGTSGYVCPHAMPEEDHTWCIKPNTHNDGNMRFEKYTTEFGPAFFEDHDEDYPETNYRPIQGLDNDYYTYDEAVERLWCLNQALMLETDSLEKKRLADEIKHFEATLIRFDTTYANSTIEDSGAWWNKGETKVKQAIQVRNTGKKKVDCSHM